MENHVHNLTDQEREAVDKLRDLFNGKIPEDLDTDLNLLRWIKGWKGQLNEIEPRLKSYIQNRRLTKIDGEDFLEKFETFPIYHKVFKYFGFSLADKPYVNTKDNTLFMSERLENVNFHSITNKALTCGEIINSSFQIMEAMFRHVLTQEKRSGRPSGITVIYDMYKVNALEYANPNCPIIKISKLCFAILNDYYCDVLNKIYVINAPMFIGLLWEIGKRFLAPATQKKVVILGSNYIEVLRNHFDLDVLPVQYGGNRRDTSGRVDPDTCCNVPVFIPEDYKRVSIDCDDFITEYIKPNSSFELRKTVEISETKLLWKFWVNSEVEFCVLKEISSKLF